MAAVHDDTASPTRRDVLRLAGLGLLGPAFLWSCSGGDGAATSFSATIAEARSAILKALGDTDTSAISVALIGGDRVVWSEAFGVIDKAGTTPTADTMFAIGSVSKVIAAIAAMILVDEQRVGLDDPLVQHVTDFRMASPEYAQVTIRMLLSHSSGFPGTEYRSSATSAPFTGYARQVQETLATARLKHAPGELAVYCNDGFAMIEPLVRVASGMSYAQFVEDRILAPLGMSHSHFPLALFPDGSYAPAFEGGVRQPQECVNAHAGGGLYSTPSDVGRLAMMLMNGGQLEGRRVLSAAAVAEMARDQTTTLPFNPVPTYRYGLGWDGVTEAGLETVGVTAWHKNGGTIFYGSELLVAPVERLAVMITGTSTRYGALRLAELVLLHALAERGSIAAVPEPLPNVALAPRAPGDADFAAIAGCYGRHDAVFRMEPQPDGTLTLFQDAEGSWRAKTVGLKLRKDGTYSTDAAPHASFRAFAADGRQYVVARVANGYGHYELEVLYGQRMVPRSPLSAAWQARVGRKWLAVNEHPLEIAPDLSAGLHAVPELPGYVITNKGQIVDPAGDDTRARMCLKLPMVYGSDLNDVVIEPRGGEEWLRIGSFLYRPQATVPALAAGSHVVTIGDEGLGEWRRLPASGTLSIAGVTAWVLLDAGFQMVASGTGGGSASLPGRGEATYLLACGPAGGAIPVAVG